MIYREQGYLSDSAPELINLVRNFNWDSARSPALSPAIAGPRLIEYQDDARYSPAAAPHPHVCEPEALQPTSG